MTMTMATTLTQPLPPPHVALTTTLTLTLTPTQVPTSSVRLGLILSPSRAWYGSCLQMGISRVRTMARSTRQTASTPRLKKSSATSLHTAINKRDLRERGRRADATFAPLDLHLRMKNGACVMADMHPLDCPSCTIRPISAGPAPIVCPICHAAWPIVVGLYMASWHHTDAPQDRQYGALAIGIDRMYSRTPY